MFTNSNKHASYDSMTQKKRYIKQNFRVSAELDLLHADECWSFDGAKDYGTTKWSQGLRKFSAYSGHINPHKT